MKEGLIHKALEIRRMLNSTPISGQTGRLVVHEQKAMSAMFKPKEYDKVWTDEALPMSSEPPKVRVAERADMLGYALQGWEQFDRWANMNEPLWRCASDEYKRRGYSDEDRIKLLAYGLMCALRDRTQADIKKAMESTTPMFPLPR